MKKICFLVVAVFVFAIVGFSHGAKADSPLITVLQPQSGISWECPGPSYPIVWTNATGKSVFIELTVEGDMGAYQWGPFPPDATSTSVALRTASGGCFPHYSSYKVTVAATDANGTNPDFGVAGSSGDFTVASESGPVASHTASETLIPVYIILVGVVLFFGLKLKKILPALTVWWMATILYLLVSVPVIQIFGQGLLVLTGLPAPMGLMLTDAVKVTPAYYIFMCIAIIGVILSIVALIRAKSRRWALVFIALAIFAFAISWVNVQAGTCDIDGGFDSVYLACSYGIEPALPSFFASSLLLASAWVLYRRREDQVVSISSPKVD